MIMPKYVPKIVLDTEGKPVCPWQILPVDWERYLDMGRRIIEATGIPWKEIVEKEMVRMPPIRKRTWRNRWARRLMHSDYVMVLEDLKRRKIKPTITRIAMEMGIDDGTLRSLNKRKQWNVTFSHSQPKRRKPLRVR